ncbi:leucine-rich repeat protein [Tanacetum coccineum]
MYYASKRRDKHCSSSSTVSLMKGASLLLGLMRKTIAANGQGLSKFLNYIGSLENLRYLNLSSSNFGGIIPHQLGNLSELHTLCLGTFQYRYYESTSVMNMEWLSNLLLLRHLDMSNVDLSKAMDCRSRDRNSLFQISVLEISDCIWKQLNIKTPTCKLDSPFLAEDWWDIPRCFINFSVLSGEETFFGYDPEIYTEDILLKDVISSDSLVMKGHENHLTGRIPEKIGDMKELESFDLSLNKLSGELPLSLSSLNFLSNFNVSYNRLTGRIPSSTQLQSLNESCFVGNKLCGDPLTERCSRVEAPDTDHEEGDGSHGTDIYTNYNEMVTLWKCLR